MKPYLFSAEKRAILEGMPQPFAVYQYVDQKVVTLVLSDGFCALFGYADREKAYADMNRSIYTFIHPDDTERASGAAQRFIAEGGMYDVIYRTKNRAGNMYQIVHAMGKHVREEDGTRLAYVWFVDEGVYSDDADLQSGRLTDALSHALHEGSILKATRYDHLTGLPSMTHFFQLAEDAKARIRREGDVPVLLYIDLTGMKFFNTKHSFAEGDRLLQAVAGLLIRTFGEECCCRSGADHFGAFTRGEGLEAVLDRLLLECQEINGGDSLPMHIGIYPNDLEDVPVSAAYDRAKLACDGLKKTYKSCYSYYKKELRDEAELRQYIISNLDRAIRENWIQVYYQPIVRAVNGRVCDDEALARWIDPVMGFLSPADFIPFLEDAGVIYKLDLYMLEQILKKIRQQLDAGVYVVPQSLNLSRADFDACDVVEEIRKRVDAAGIRRDRITIEITESTLGSDFEFMKEQVARFQQLGFPVWMDDFGSGYSSLDVLQSIKFDLIKFDMCFMQKLDEGDSGKIILTELMKMATALGVDTVCEGVETAEQVRFLREIGCSKLQGYYFAKPTPLEKLIKDYAAGRLIGYEDPAESAYYEAIGRVNLFDLAVIANEDSRGLHNFFNTIPMAILELREDSVNFIRSNQSYRDFLLDSFGLDISDPAAAEAALAHGESSGFLKLVRQCRSTDSRALFDEQLPDGSTVHAFARRISTNPVTGRTAVAVAILSINPPDEGTTYASIARALAADYYNLYYVELDTERFIEYTSPVGGEELAMERHGENFFRSAKEATMTRIYEEDRAAFLEKFTKENILLELDTQGVFTATYRLMDSGAPIYVNMKIMRMQPDGRHLIIGISTIDAQIKQEKLVERLQREAAAYARVMALSGDYLTLYTIDPDTGSYYEYIATKEYESLGLGKTGEDFFRQALLDGEKNIYAEDLPEYLRDLTKENIFRQIREQGGYHLRYRLMINGRPQPMELKIVSVREPGGTKLIAGVRAAGEQEK